MCKLEIALHFLYVKPKPSSHFGFQSLEEDILTQPTQSDIWFNTLPSALATFSQKSKATSFTGFDGWLMVDGDLVYLIKTSSTCYLT